MVKHTGFGWQRADDAVYHSFDKPGVELARRQCEKPAFVLSVDGQGVVESDTNMYLEE